MEAEGFSRILVALELEPGDESLMAHALALALGYRAELLLAHVRERWTEEDPWTEVPSPRLLAARWGLTDADGARAALRARGVQLRRIHARGLDVVAELSEIGQHQVPDLLLTGTHQRQGMARVLEGSVAEALARRLRCPALFLPHGKRGFVDVDTGQAAVRRLLLPVGADVDPRPLLDRALHMLAALGAPLPEVVALHVGSPDTVPLLPRPPGVELTWVVREDVVSRAILDEAVAVSADLIVMGTRGHDSLLDLLAGSTTERVLRGSPCPLLSIPLGDAP